MTYGKLTVDEIERSNELLLVIRRTLEALSNGDKALLFAYRRKVYKHLIYDERGPPMARRKLKQEKWLEQGGRCAICSKQLPAKYAVLDRLCAVDGYTKENTRLVHQECDVEQQASKGYT